MLKADSLELAAEKPKSVINSPPPIQPRQSHPPLLSCLLQISNFRPQAKPPTRNAELVLFPAKASLGMAQGSSGSSLGHKPHIQAGHRCLDIQGACNRRARLPKECDTQNNPEYCNSKCYTPNRRTALKLTLHSTRICCETQAACGCTGLLFGVTLAQKFFTT